MSSDHSSTAPLPVWKQRIHLALETFASIAIVGVLFYLTMPSKAPTQIETQPPIQKSAAQEARQRPNRARPMRLPEGVKRFADVAYVEAGHERHKLDIYIPEAIKEGAKLPLVIWIHGGAWQAGSKENCPAIGLTEKGFAVASINYRLSQHAIFPAQIEDCKAAIRYLRKNADKYHLDPDKFGVWGSSAGGHLVALVGTSGEVKELETTTGEDTTSSRVQAVCNWFGPTDLIAMGGSHNRENSPESKLLGGSVQEKKELAAKANPITYITKDDPPFLNMHGDKDPVVPLSQSELLQTALEKAGVPSELVVLEGAGHGGPQFSSPDMREKITSFFQKHLTTAEAN